MKSEHYNKKGIYSLNCQITKIERYTDLVGSLEIVVDAGGFVGAWCIALTQIRKYNPPKIYTIEPCYPEELTRNTSPYPNITVCPFGFSNATKIESFFARDSRSATMGGKETDRDHMKAQCYSWDDFVDKFGLKKVDLLKLDIETAEIQFFETISKVWPEFIEIEFHNGSEKKLPRLYEHYHLVKDLEVNAYVYRIKV